MTLSGGYFHGYYNGTEYPFYVGNNYVANNTPSYKLALGYNASTQKIEAFVDGKKQSFGDTLPVGTILPYVGAIANIPTGWALCNGANGTPNLTGRFLEGVTSASAAKKTHAAGLPNLTGRTSHSFGWQSPLIQGLIGANGGTGVFSGPHTGYDCNTIQQSDNVYSNGSPYIYFDASKCNSIYGNSTTVQPESYTVLYIMKIKA